METVMLVALFAAPAGMLLGFLAGALLCYRAMRGLPPVHVPSFTRPRAELPPGKERGKESNYPKVGA